IAPSQLDKLEKFVHVRPPKTDYEEDIKQAISSVTDNEGLKKCLDLFLTNHAAQTWVGKHEYANAGQVSDFIKVCEKVGSSAPLVTLWQSAYRYGVDPTVPLLRSSAAACAALGEGADAALVLLYGSCYIVNVPEDLAAAVRTALEAHEKAQEGNAEALAKVQKYREALDRL
uniref:mS106 n=1 Tax=Polytomella magna TaxID=353565 RepID=UPI002240E51D|nr:Chain BE, mS106 [Polytomella magna]8APN_BE Chain BE, mS106 [Polytomella magna]8APO_BE Chain BE, mS106 [Polytomella magna]